jgi:outer membrane lipopolysaccharide assembly protein LptE/RlpB
MASGIAPWLTPLAAIGLTTTVLMAAGFHLRANEYLEAVETMLWASVTTTVAIGRWELVVASVHVPPGTIVAALAVLVPAAIVNVAILVARPVRTAAAASVGIRE